MRTIIKDVRVLYFILFALVGLSYIFGVALDVLGKNHIYVRTIVICYLLCVIFFSLMINPKISRIQIYLFIIILSLVFLWFTHNSPIVINFIFLMMFIFLTQTKKLTKVEFISSGLVAMTFVLLIYLFYLMLSGLSLEPVIIGERERYSFGFTNPNKMGVICYSLVTMASIYSLKLNKSLYKLTLLVFPCLVIMFYTDSRTAMLATIIFLLMSMSNFWIKFRKVLWLLPIILLIASLYLAVFDISDSLNKFLSYRPNDFNYFVSQTSAYDFLIGTSSEEYRLDNSYLLMYFNMGPVLFLLLVYSVKRFSNLNKCRYDFAFIVSVLVYGFFEGILVRMEFIIILYFYFVLFSRTDDIEAKL